MLEVCPSLAAQQPRRAKSIRWGSAARRSGAAGLHRAAGPAVNAAMLDLGDRFRLLVNEVDAMTPQPLPRLPVARAFWSPRPDFQNGRCGVDLRRRPAPHRFQPGFVDRTP